MGRDADAFDPGVYAGRPVLVIGAGGFIGARMARRLGELGARVTSAHRAASAARRPGSGGEPPARGAGADPGETVALDLCDPEAPGRVLARVRPDVVFNLAGYGVDPAERDESLAEEVNHRGVARLARALASSAERAPRAPTLVHVGSALEYGRAGGDLHEGTPERPDTLYGRSKLRGTLALAEVCRRHGLAGLTARLFTVYGPGERSGRLLPSLLAAARDPGRGRIPLSAGLQRRDFTFVDDVVEGLLRLGASRPEPGEIVNLATGRLESVRRFAETTAEVLGIAADRLAFGELPTRAEEMKHEPVAIARLRTRVGWVPCTSIAEGVRRTWEVEAAA